MKLSGALRYKFARAAPIVETIVGANQVYHLLRFPKERKTYNHPGLGIPSQSTAGSDHNIGLCVALKTLLRFELSDSNPHWQCQECRSALHFFKF